MYREATDLRDFSIPVPLFLRNETSISFRFSGSRKFAPTRGWIYRSSFVLFSRLSSSPISKVLFTPFSYGGGRAIILSLSLLIHPSSRWVERSKAFLQLFSSCFARFSAKQRDHNEDADTFFTSKQSCCSTRRGRAIKCIKPLKRNEQSKTLCLRDI